MDLLEGYRAEGYVKEFTRHCNDVLLNLNELRHRSILTDATLVVGSHHLQAHCAVLVACRLVHRPTCWLQTSVHAGDELMLLFMFPVASSTHCTPAVHWFIAAAEISSSQCLSPTRWTRPASPCCLTSCTPPGSLWHPALPLVYLLSRPTYRWTTWLKPAENSCSCTGEHPITFNNYDGDVWIIVSLMRFHVLVPDTLRGSRPPKCL